MVKGLRLCLSILGLTAVTGSILFTLNSCNKDDKISDE
jgi:hypothetical protein